MNLNLNIAKGLLNHIKTSNHNVFKLHATHCDVFGINEEVKCHKKRVYKKLKLLISVK